MAGGRGLGLPAGLMVAVLATAACSGGGAEPSAAGAAGSSSSSAADPRLELPEPSPPAEVTVLKDATDAARDDYLGYVTDLYSWSLNTGFDAALIKVLPGRELDATAGEIFDDLDRIRQDGIVVTSDPLRIEKQRCQPFQRSQVGGYWLCQFDWVVDHIDVATADGEVTGHDGVTSTVRVAVVFNEGQGITIDKWAVDGDLPSAVIP